MSWQREFYPSTEPGLPGIRLSAWRKIHAVIIMSRTEIERVLKLLMSLVCCFCHEPKQLSLSYSSLKAFGPTDSAERERDVFSAFFMYTSCCEADMMSVNLCNNIFSVLVPFIYRYSRCKMKHMLIGQFISVFWTLWPWRPSWTKSAGQMQV